MSFSKLDWIFVTIERNEPILKWCYVCGRSTDYLAYVKIVCPNCCSKTIMRLCIKCAEKLRDELNEALKMR
ncbi:MAG: hypothetical protein NDF57_05160 [archaeon GBS-70-058]|nr:hypothetical protein [Candidatus Culexarchaeum nevadense]